MPDRVKRPGKLPNISGLPASPRRGKTATAQVLKTYYFSPRFVKRFLKIFFLSQCFVLA
jgi:hypothetical protein